MRSGLRFRPIGWIAGIGTLAAMAATLAVAAPGGATPGPEKTFTTSFAASCVLAPGVLNERGVLKVTESSEGPSTLERQDEFSLPNNRISVTTPREWGESFFALGSRSAKGFLQNVTIVVTNAEPTEKNIAKPPEFPSGLPIKTKVENREVEFTVPSEERTFSVGSFRVTGKRGEEVQGYLSTKPGFREPTPNHFEATGEGILSEITGFNESGEANVGPVQVACTAPEHVQVYDAAIIGEGTTTVGEGTTTVGEGTTTVTTTAGDTTGPPPETTPTESTTATTSTALKVKLNDKLTGFLRVKKLENQKITLPEGCTFIGEGEIPGPFEANTKCPPFSAKLKILGLPSTLGTELVQVQPAKGTITPQENGKLLIKGSTTDNIKITSLGILGLSLPVSCVTSSPVVFPLSAEATATELLTTGATSTGTTTLPSVHCGGFLGGVVGSLITVLMSGPNNEFSFTISP